MHRWAVWGHFGVQRVTRSRQHLGFCFLSLQMKQAQGCFYSVRCLFATLKETHKRKVCASVNLPSPLVPAGKVTRKLGKRGTNHYLHPCSSTPAGRKNLSCKFSKACYQHICDTLVPQKHSSWGKVGALHLKKYIATQSYPDPQDPRVSGAVVYKSLNSAPRPRCSVCSALNWDNHVPSSGLSVIYLYFLGSLTLQFLAVSPACF